MNRALTAWLDGLTKTDCTIDSSSLKLPYTSYGCMLLLPHNAFESTAWRGLGPDQDAFSRLYELLAKHLKVTHIAINKPIPLHDSDTATDNTLRAPQNFTPVYGDFGPAACSSPPSQEDINAAFWVTAKQNDIYQTWAPRWTMFSRGNISEKARLLTLPSVLGAVEQGRRDGKGCAAVDLYAGIGYFTFSYLKAGVDQVLGWDINPWSIEGLRRGAAKNKWRISDMHSDSGQEDYAEARLLIFEESNEHALERLSGLRPSLPPVRHVNCGLLPGSSCSWQIALSAVDPVLGGWVHVHGNFAVGEIDEKAEQIRKEFHDMAKVQRPGSIACLDSIYRVKSYAPGVVHCVLDIYVLPDHEAL